ncbi:ABC transporter permease subunit [Pseudoflavitalea rhizosphaerae]|uniref:ABC transporter permease subunit n=1 Tax=Pseudoflavitalea rhizosphaerae TaxID=1884793 RepID=UPI000F8D669A|nr:Gldg family protein [Pseudoflavitalea rhizosphaerae]
MKMIFKIARTEIKNLFYSPVAWFLTIAFLVQCGYFFTEAINGISKFQDLQVRNNPGFKGFEGSLTGYVFLGNESIFKNVLQNLYLFIPLLTMGLISREISNGTVKLLYSSPVKTRQIVLGKYLAIMAYNLMLLLIVGVFMSIGALSIKDVDYGLLLSAALGFYLLVCAYTAIGMFMSSLTTYQIVSALATFLFIFILTRIGTLWQQYDFIRDLTYFLSLAGRTNKMLEGLITTRDVIYFVLVTTMFVAFTVFRLRGTRESKPWYIKGSRYLAMVLAVLAIGYITSRPGNIGYLDATARKINTIHERTQDIINKMDGPMEIILYTNLLGDGLGRALPESRNHYIWDFWERYFRFKPDIKYSYAMYYDVADNNTRIFKTYPNKTLKEIAQENTNFRGYKLDRWMEPAEIRKKIDLKDEYYRVVMQVKYNGRTAFLRTFNDNQFWPDEEIIAATFKKLLIGEGPKVYFSTGSLERSIHKTGEREYYSHALAKNNRRALINLAFQFDTVSLDQRDVPKDATLLVLADPKVELSPVKLRRLEKYVNDGGDLFALTEPGKQAVMNPVIQQLGARYMDGTLVEITKDEMPHMIKPYITPAFSMKSEESAMFAVRRKMIEADTSRRLLPGAAGIAVNDSAGFQINHLLVTTKGRNTWAKVGKLVVDSAAPVFSTATGDYKMDTFSTAVSLNRKINNRAQRIVLAGDADWMSTHRNGGDYISRTIYSWIDNNRFPVYTPRPAPEDNLLTVSVGGTSAMKTIFRWIIPAAVLALAIVLLIRRKRQ